MITMEQLVADIHRKGPTRVIVDNQGYAMTPDQALLEYGIVPDVVFIRSDGWSLGAPFQWSRVAYNLWDGDWIAKLQL